MRDSAIDFGNDSALRVALSRVVRDAHIALALAGAQRFIAAIADAVTPTLRNTTAQISSG
eukprot:6185572-Pleurochrysis_carterae.AAC.3